jgi:ABC-type transport system substrate-binding protein
MRSIRTKIELLTFALALGCSARVAPPLGEDRDVPPARGGTLRAAFFFDVRTLDPALAFDAGASVIELLIYDTLVSYDANGQIVPQLAERVDVSSDGKRYTFLLRRGVLMHDGSELTAADVKRSMERLLHVKTPCPAPSFYDRIVGYADYHDGKSPELTGVRVEGDYQVSFELGEPDATFLQVLALPFAAPLCKSAGATWDRQFSNQACGAGPFKVVRYENGQVIKLVRHEGYWDKGKPYLDAVEWSLSMQSFTQRFKFERGDLDYLRELSEADVWLYRRSPEWKDRGQWSPSLTSEGLFMNTEMPPFDDVHIRRAVSFALDRDELASVRPGNIKPHAKIVPTPLIPASPGYPVQVHDLGRALEEMRLAGYPFDPVTGQGGYPREIPYLAIVDSFAQTAAEIYQQQLAKIGIRLRIQVVSTSTHLAKTGRRRTVPMGWAGWQADFPDPSNFFEPILTTKSIQDEESQNHAFFSNAELDQVTERARRSRDADERSRLYRRAEEIVRDEVPWAVTYTYSYFELTQPYLKGYRPHPVLSQYVRGVWMDLEAKRRIARKERCTGLTLACAGSHTKTTLGLAWGVR